MSIRESNDGRYKPALMLGGLRLSLLFLSFFAMGLLFEVLILRDFAQAMRQRFWKHVPCMIVVSEVQEVGSKLPYTFTVSYRYDYGGQPYSGYEPKARVVLLTVDRLGNSR